MKTKFETIRQFNKPFPDVIVVDADKQWR